MTAFDAERSAAIEARLALLVTRRPLRERHPRIVATVVAGGVAAGIALLVALAPLVRAGTVALHGTATGGVAGVPSSPSAAPSGGPGQTVYTPLASPVTTAGTGSATVDLGDRPAGADAVQWAVWCLDTGTITLPGGTISGCTPADGADDLPSSSYVWTPGADVTFDVAADAGMRWRVTTTWARTTRVPLATNAAGESYGSSGDGDQPDLVAVVATNGREGYARATQLEEAEGGQPANPEEALEWTRGEGRCAHAVPVYEADGVTVIGQFVIGANQASTCAPIDGDERR